MGEPMVLKLPVGPTPSTATDARLEARRKHELEQVRELNAAARAARRKRMERMQRLMQFARSRTLGAAADVTGRVGDALGVRGPLMAARAGLSGPITPSVVARNVWVAVGIVGARLLSGRSFENMGNNLRSFLFGEVTSDNLAAEDARAEMESSPQMMRIMGMGDKANSQIREVFNEIKRVKKLSAKGRQILEDDPTMQVNWLSDQIILRGQELTKMAFKAAGGEDALNRWAQMWQEQGMTNPTR